MPNEAWGTARSSVTWTLSAAVRLGYLNHPYLSSEPSLVACLGDGPAYHALLEQVEPRWRALVDWEERAGI